MTRPPSPGREGRPFAKALGFDFIVRPDGSVVLIELQHHYGRLGLMRLYPAAAGSHRRLTRALRGRYGTDPALYESLRRICTDKISTWRLLRNYQPPSFPFLRWSRPLERWLGSLRSPYLLAKPRRGGCGRGILVFRADEFHQRSLGPSAAGTFLLQEYVESRPIAWDGGRRVGCIRHIAHLCSDGRGLSFIHLPSYWRVSPAPFTATPAREAFTANISTGAHALPVGEQEGEAVRRAAEAVAVSLLRGLGRGSLRRGPSSALSPAGEVTPLDLPPPQPSFPVAELTTGRASGK